MNDDEIKDIIEYFKWIYENVNLFNVGELNPNTFNNKEYHR
jgi:hypothetical protein